MKLEFDSDHIDSCEIQGDNIVVYFNGGINIIFRKSDYEKYIDMEMDDWWGADFEWGVLEFLEYKTQKNG